MTYASTVLGDSPWAYWKCDETSGSTLADSSGNTRPLTITGSPTLAQTGPGGSADAIAWLDSSGGTEYYAATSATFGSSAATFEAWVYLTALPTHQTGIVCQGTSYGGGGADKYMYIGTDGKVRFYIFNGGQLTVASSNALSLNAWHHIVASVGAAGTKIRTDKVTDGSTGNTGSTSGAVKVFLHGGGADGTSGNAVNPTDSSAVKIAEVAIWNSQLSDSQTDAHFNAMSPAVSATVNPPVATATASAPAPVVSASSSIAPPVATASAAALAPSVATTGDATVAVPPATATATAVAPTWTNVIVVATDTSNEFYGLEMALSATVEVTVPIATPPVAQSTTRVDKAIALPEPVLVKGRPT